MIANLVNRLLSILEPCEDAAEPVGIELEPDGALVASLWPCGNSSSLSI